MPQLIYLILQFLILLYIRAIGYNLHPIIFCQIFIKSFATSFLFILIETSNFGLITLVLLIHCILHLILAVCRIKAPLILLLFKDKLIKFQIPLHIQICLLLRISIICRYLLCLFQFILNLIYIINHRSAKI